MILGLRDLVYIIPIDDPDISVGGIHIPASAKERVDQGIVKYIGPKVVDLKIGDYIFFSGYNGTTNIIEGERLIVMSEKAIQIRLDLKNESFTIPGLYFRDHEGHIIPASYEIAMDFIGDAVEKLEGYNQNYKLRNRDRNKPDLTKEN